jgi:hypothetical protein
MVKATGKTPHHHEEIRATLELMAVKKFYWEHCHHVAGSWHGEGALQN